MIRGMLFLSSFLAALQISFADVLTLNNGYVFQGELLSKTDKNLVFKTDFGEIKADLNSVSKLDVKAEKEAVVLSSKAAPQKEGLKEADGEFNIEKYIVNLGLVFKLTEVVDVAMRYFYSYNNVNSPSAQKEEERILLSFELPLK
ncbi:MAG: hypothetical protein J6R08_05530 [Opitutales bacterium]|nr:hypothetical protein [Opitutales bacterium]